MNEAPGGTALGPIEAIGLVRTSHTDVETTPVQSGLNLREIGTIELFEPYVEGLVGLEGFEYLWLLTWLGQRWDPRERPPLTQVPSFLRRQQRSVGLFAMRGPHRVNPIGLSLVRLLDVSDRRIRFAGVDLVDKTPLIDLKPYVTTFDRPEGEPACGWFDTVSLPEGATPASLAPQGGEPN